MSPMRVVIPLVLSFTFYSTASAQDYRYALMRLPSQNESLKSDGAGASNAFGDVVGSAPTKSIWWPRAVLWPRGGGVIDLGTLGGDLAGAGDINELGEIVGSSGFEPGGSIFVGRAFLWRDGEMIDLGTLGGETSVARAINNQGQIVGDSEYEPNNFADRGFLWQDGVMTALPAIRKGSYAGQAESIAESGRIIGTSVDERFEAKGTLWIDLEPIDLGSLSGRGSDAEAINDLGQIVGTSTAQNGSAHAVVWIEGQIIDIHSSQFGNRTNSWGQDINNAGQVIGAIGDSLGTREMFIRESGQPMRLLKELVPPQARENWRLDRGHINDAGQISATAYIRGTIDRFAVLLTPVRPTMEMEPPSPGSAGVANTITVHNATPGARVTFLYSRHGGGERIPGCDLQQNALQLDSPTVIGTAIADQSGVATITRTVPPVARNQTILFQAVVQNECAISQLVVHTFE
ncbi:MAG: hypothetical protein KJZ69_07605 [Phycisphaerales bacterium]|nr:hypothetical protein [Phycisphaerales bacterium]